MYSIGFMSESAAVKVPTIRYYESIGLMPRPKRNAGNQRRYSVAELEQLKFIKHARQLGFETSDIAQLISLKVSDSLTCEQADLIAQTHVTSIRNKILALQNLEQELVRVSACDSSVGVRECNILKSIADHQLCGHEHS